MRVIFPVCLDNGTIIHGNESFFLINNSPEFSGVNGLDADNKRVTNIVGFDGKDLLKKCTHCREIKQSENGFGTEGRSTSPGQRRDQAQCNECRNRY